MLSRRRANAGEQRLARSALRATPAFAPTSRVKYQSFRQTSWFVQHKSYSLAFLRSQAARQTSWSRLISFENSISCPINAMKIKDLRKKNGQIISAQVSLQRFPVHPRPSCIEMFAVFLGEVGM